MRPTYVFPPHNIPATVTIYVGHYMKARHEYAPFKGAGRDIDSAKEGNNVAGQRICRRIHRLAMQKSRQAAQLTHSRTGKLGQSVLEIAGNVR